MSDAALRRVERAHAIEPGHDAQVLALAIRRGWELPRASATVRPWDAEVRATRVWIVLSGSLAIVPVRDPWVARRMIRRGWDPWPDWPDSATLTIDREDPPLCTWHRMIGSESAR